MTLLKAGQSGGEVNDLFGGVGEDSELPGFNLWHESRFWWAFRPKARGCEFPALLRVGWGLTAEDLRDGFEEVGDGLLGAQALGEEGLVVDGLGDLFRGYARAGIDELVDLIFANGPVLLEVAANGIDQNK